MVFFHAEYISPHFQFDAYGPTAAHAFEVLRDALMVHAAQARIHANWFRPDHITIREVVMGAGYRDNERIG